MQRKRQEPRAKAKTLRSRWRGSAQGANPGGPALHPSLAPSFVPIVAAFDVGARAQAALFQAADEIGASARDSGAVANGRGGALAVDSWWHLFAPKKPHAHSGPV